MADSFKDVESLAHLKRVSRIKHQILGKYFPSWAVILGSSNKTLYFVDCFAGPGQYEFEDKVVDGSPLIAVRAGMEYASSHPESKINVLLVDDDANQIVGLEGRVRRTEPHPNNFSVAVKHADSHEYIPQAIAKLREKSAPAFVLVDPYGHPLSVSTMNQLLSRPRTELLINLMWYRINMDMANPLVRHHVTELLGDEDWMSQPFINQSGLIREEEFLNYFLARLGAKFALTFRIKFDPEDKISGSRTKYYLIHASNHVKAALLMKEVMWPLGDEEGTFEFAAERQHVLISRTPHENDLRDALQRIFASSDVTFDQIRAQTWDLPFIEKHYRSVIQRLRAEGSVLVHPVTSKGTGIQKHDRVQFIR